MDGIPAEFWMVIISVITLFLVFIMYQLSLLLKETTKTVGETAKVVTELQDTVRKANVVIEDASEVMTMAKDTVSDLQTDVVKPLLSIASVVGTVAELWESFSGGFKSSR